MYCGEPWGLFTTVYFSDYQTDVTIYGSLFGNKIDMCCGLNYVTVYDFTTFLQLSNVAEEHNEAVMGTVFSIKRIYPCSPAGQN